MEEIIKGNLRSFSISGNALKKHPSCDSSGCQWNITEVELYELTVCSDPVLPIAKFDAIQLPSIDVCPNCANITKQ